MKGKFKTSDWYTTALVYAISTIVIQLIRSIASGGPVDIASWLVSGIIYFLLALVVFGIFLFLVNSITWHHKTLLLFVVPLALLISIFFFDNAWIWVWPDVLASIITVFFAIYLSTKNFKTLA